MRIKGHFVWTLHLVCIWHGQCPPPFPISVIPTISSEDIFTLSSFRQNLLVRLFSYDGQSMKWIYYAQPVNRIILIRSSASYFLDATVIHPKLWVRHSSLDNISLFLTSHLYSSHLHTIVFENQRSTDLSSTLIMSIEEKWLSQFWVG